MRFNTRTSSVSIRENQPERVKVGAIADHTEGRRAFPGGNIKPVVQAAGLRCLVMFLWLARSDRFRLQPVLLSLKRIGRQRHSASPLTLVKVVPLNFGP